MKKKTLLGVALLAIAFATLLSDCNCAGCGNGGNNGGGTITVPTTVSFGSQGACVGSGICKCSMPDTSGHKKLTKLFGTPVSFSLDPNNAPSGILMSFLISDLLNYQPGAQQYLIPPAATATSTFPFPVGFPLGAQLCGLLDIPQNSSILPGSIGNLSTSPDGTTITIAVGTSQANYVTANVVFGNQVNVGGPACDPTQEGICSANTQAGAQPGSIAVSFMLVPNNPQAIQMSFSLAALQAAPQLQQYQLITTSPAGTAATATTYTFSSTFYFNGPANGGVFLQAQPPLALLGGNPNIPQGTVAKVTVNGDMVTYTCAYSPQ